MSVTIKDIAERAGVSFSTVSKALRNSPLVQESTKRKIMEIAENMGYQPNYTARRLVSKKSNVIGVVWPSITRSTLSRLITGINNKLESQSYTTMLSINRPESAIEAFRRLQVDAILLFADQDYDAGARMPSSKELPILHYGIAGQADCPTIDVQRGKAIELALDHLIELGHRHIAYIGAPEYRDPLQDQKIRAYRSRMESANLKPHVAEVTGMESHDGYFAAKTLLTGTAAAPTAIVCGSYDLARGILRAAEECGVPIPDRLSVICYDNFKQTDDPDVPLTAVGAHFDAISERIAAALIQMASGETVDSTILLEPELVVRSSSARPPD